MKDGRLGTIGDVLHDSTLQKSELWNCPVYRYARPAMSVDMVVFDERGGHPRVLLIERGSEPFKGMLALPGGYVNIDETSKDAAIRELEEETGIIVLHNKVDEVGFFDRVDRNPIGRVLSMAYYCMYDGQPIKAADDAVSYQWCNVRCLKNLAFDHREIVEKAYGKLW